MSILSSASWFLACAYLFVAAFTLFRARFRPADGIPPGQLILFAIAFVYALAWPARAMRRAIELAGWSSSR